MCKFVRVPSRFYQLATGDEITIKHAVERGTYMRERSKVRKRILASDAHLFPGVLEVVNDPASSVIFLAVKEDANAEHGFLGFVVVNTSFIVQQRIVVIAWISVLSRFRGIHVGRSLLQHVEVFCRVNGVELMEVMCTDGYTKLFRRHGFFTSVSPFAFKKKALQKRVVVPSLPRVPFCVSSGVVCIRYARQETRRKWVFLALEACGYSLGGGDLIRRIFDAEFRIEAVDAKEDRVVAILSMDRQGWIPLIACVTEYRGRGLGSFLLFMAMEWMRREGGSSVSLAPLNSSVVHFYKRWAFQASSVGGKKRRRGSRDSMVLVRAIDLNAHYIPDGHSLEDFLSVSTPETPAAAQQSEGEAAAADSSPNLIA
ncbi:N-acetyltransferase [Trypanosoma rangeli]|uniref:N-acetyltransferase n=1 Tax=Trypanosoma rangeli TaxID=5698 RepID=A0A422NYB0_TRYRA|nr:N-acetyltransferase [Trypanosoma rangeli]RNF10409.1 N-acetyltransferase [Trypanosoma rangeli]|eukprot:RNF10409.1 N-acetyltransferase [Trypanosoma rangeli]